MISNTSSTHGTPPPSISTDLARKASTPTPPPAAEDVLSTANIEHLRAALESTPEIRPEVVERGMQLAVDANYPPRAIIEQIARQIVRSEDLTRGE
ncbi:MAG TPA: hypothetical protein VHF69_06555 [Candidatus Synoicihabitans sp.]|nr:hypothetical protein [Candidatus Synoicihabitans sp.]